MRVRRFGLTVRFAVLAGVLDCGEKAVRRSDRSARCFFALMRTRGWLAMLAAWARLTFCRELEERHRTPQRCHR